MSGGHCLLAIAVALLTAVAMEGWAAVLHRHLWHRRWWPLHRSHHRRHRSRLEVNDLLSLVHAPAAAGLWILGLSLPAGALAATLVGVAAGMSLFGAAYLLVHDGFVHGRLPVGALGRWRWLRRIAAAHAVHHRRGGPPFGLFSGPWVVAAARSRGRPQAPPQSHCSGVSQR